MTNKIMFSLILSLLCCTLASTHRPPLGRTSHQSPTLRDSTDGRLPRTLIPYHYNIDISPNFYLDSPPFPFDGTVSIWFECIERTNVLTVNSVGLTINSVAVAASSDSPINPPSPIVINWTLEPAANFLNVFVVNSFEPGARYVATFSYTSIINSNDYGLYWDSYVSSVDGSTKYILATQLEEHGAREMFPSFDEPDLKATFNVTVAHVSTVTALSNMPVIATAPRPNGWIANIHSQSPIMSTYQVCVCVGDLRYVEGNWQGVLDYPVRIYSRPEIINQMVQAAEVAIRTQKWLETETGIKYLLPKMDHIALPSKGGAMENWGLITYGEPFIAVNPETSSSSGQLLSASFIAHEIAHQWYGNLVTCKWWNDIWLNEGFATYYDYRPLESIGWPGRSFSQLDTQDFMDDDQKNTSDPVRKQIDTPWDAGYSFAGSTYPKGGAMVNFLEGILGLDTLRAGLTQYLNAYSYSSATTDDLWQALTDQAASEGYQVDIKAIMDPWLNQMGFPVVSVARNDDGTARVTQNRFFHPPLQAANIESPWNYKWTIPLKVVTASSSPSDWEGRPTDWFNINDTELTLSGLPTSRDEWILVNPLQKFFYRVNYDDRNLAAIVNQLIANHTVIDSLSRAQLIDDLFTLARSSYILETSAMEATRYLFKEFSYNSWSATLKYTSLTNQLIRPLSWYNEFTTYVLSQVTPVYNTLGWRYRPEETPDIHLLRRDLISTACSFGLFDCVLNSRADYAIYLENPDLNSLNPNNLPTALCRGVAEGTTDDWSMVFTQYQQRKTSHIREERWAYLFALACTNNTQLLDSLLSYITRGQLISTRDQYRATLYLSMNSDGAEKVFSYFDNSWSTVPSGMNKFAILRYITSSFADEAGLSKLNSLISKHPPQSEEQQAAFTQMVLTVEQNINWSTFNGNALRDWLIAINGPRSDKAPRMEAPLPISTLNFWYSIGAYSSPELYK